MKSEIFNNSDFAQLKARNFDAIGLSELILRKHGVFKKNITLLLLNRYLLAIGKLSSSYELKEKYQINEAKYLNNINMYLIKNMMKLVLRFFLRLQLINLVAGRSITLIGPGGKKSDETVEIKSLVLLLKIIDTDVLDQYKNNDVALIWNGTVTAMYLENPFLLPRHVKFILTKAPASFRNQIRHINKHIRVLSFKTCDRCNVGTQSLIVDSIDILRNIKTTQLKVIGIDLKTGGYEDSYLDKFKVHQNTSNTARSYSCMHTPYEDFEILKKWYNKNYFDCDETLSSLFSLSTLSFLKILEVKYYPDQFEDTPKQMQKIAT